MNKKITVKAWNALTIDVVGQREIRHLAFFNDTFGKILLHTASRMGLLRKDAAYCITGADWTLFYENGKWTVTEGK